MKLSDVIKKTLMAGIALTATLHAPQAALAQGAQLANAAPTLIITNDPLPERLQSQLYGKRRVTPIDPVDVNGPDYYQPVKTPVGQKVAELRESLFELEGNVGRLADGLSRIEDNGRARSAAYYANVATISSQLQTGTTPGNPRLVERLNVAQASLESLASNVAELNELAVDVSRVATESAFLLDAIRATYGLSGAVEEDHENLARLEDATNNTIVLIERLLNNVNDDITRSAAYLASERNNIRALSLAVSNGDLYGKSLSSRPFSNAQPSNLYPANASGPAAATGGFVQQTRTVKPLVVIRFDKPKVQYEQPLYLAVSEALERFPEARFELVAVSPQRGNTAQVAIESTRARRNAESVLRTLTQMGLPLERVKLTAASDQQARTNQVHVYVR